jgi:hypothetical protein
MIGINKVKEIREDLNMDQLIIIGVDSEGIQHVSTHGNTIKDANDAAKLGNIIKEYLGFPKELCKSVPIERICYNCTYFTPDYGTWCFNGWSGDGSNGKCGVDPKLVYTNKDRKACIYFSPNC